MSDVNYKQISLNGLWHNNPALMQLLGLCPMMAVTTNLINGLGLGIATILTLVTSSLIISIVRRFMTDEIRLPVFVLIIASVVTAIELIMHAYFYDLYKILGIFIPLIVTNCIIIGRAEAFASKNAPLPALVDAAMMGIGFTIVLVLLGAIREIFAFGTLFAQAELMFGEGAKALLIQPVKEYRGFLLAAFPPGAFIGLGLLLAFKNYLDARAEKKKAQQQIYPISTELL